MIVDATKHSEDQAIFVGVVSVVVEHNDIIEKFVVKNGDTISPKQMQEFAGTKEKILRILKDKNKNNKQKYES